MRSTTEVVMKKFHILVLLLAPCVANAQAQLPPDMRQKIDQVAADALAKTGVPSASVALVKAGQIIYLHAYGNARLNPDLPAASVMRYSSGSHSNKFTAPAVLVFQ